jgi:hypothetical protein
MLTGTSPALQRISAPGQIRRLASVGPSCVVPDSSSAQLLHPSAPQHELGIQQLVTIARKLAGSGRWDHDLENPTERCWKLLAASDSYEAWVIAWPSGGLIELHDHGDSAGAVVVSSGTLVEHAATMGTQGSVISKSSVLRTGIATTFGAGYVHDIVNLSDSPAISVHVYSPRLTSMTYYSVNGGRLVPGRTEAQLVCTP